MADINTPTIEDETAALKKRTQAIRDNIAAMQSADVAARAAVADSARQAQDTLFRLTSGEGLRSPITDQRQDDGITTILGRTIARPTSSAMGRGSAAAPYSANSSAAATPVTAATVLVGAGRSGDSGGGSTSQKRVAAQ